MLQEDGLGPLGGGLTKKRRGLNRDDVVQNGAWIYMIIIIMIMFLICAINMALTCVKMHDFVACSFLCDVIDRTPPLKTSWTAPRWSKIAFMMTQDGHMMAPRWPLDDAQVAVGPKWPRDGPRWPRGDPRWPHDGPRWPQDGLQGGLGGGLRSMTSHKNEHLTTNACQRHVDIGFTPL